MRRSLLLIPVFFIFSCHSISEDTYAVCSTFDENDLMMNDLIREIKEKYKSNRFFGPEFDMEQVYWIQYRDKRLRSIYPYDWNTYYRREYGKEVFNPCKCEELNRMTLRRIKELELYLQGGPSDQKECPSIWNE